MKEFIVRKKYWVIGAIVSFIGVGITKIPWLLNISNNQYYQISGFLVAVIGLFLIAVKLKK
jgi:hypothetical protein